jgi:hypothetical protein
MPKKSPHEKLLAKLVKYEKQVGMLAPKPPSNARMKLRNKPVKKHKISLKSLIPEYDDTHLVYGPRRSGFQVGKLVSKAFAAHDPGYDETADFLKSKGLGYRRKRKGYY